jgi:nucleotide-binding universal stress UspA family protein
VYHDILIPTDGSEGSEAAVEQGVAIASDCGATVHFLYVVDIGEEMSASGVGTIADDLAETHRQEAEDALGDGEQRAETAGVGHEREILEGVPHEAITQYADERDTDLVVVGASGESGLTDRLLGTTSEKVVSSADASVLVARP